MRYRKLLALITLLLGVGMPLAAYAARVPIENFARSPPISSPHLAPDGRHLVVTVYDEAAQRYRLAIYALQGNQLRLVRNLDLISGLAPRTVAWVGADDLIVELARPLGSLETPVSTGEILGTDISGNREIYLYGQLRPPPHVTGGAAPDPDKGWAYFDGTPQPQNDHFAMAVNDSNGSDRTRLFDVNARSGQRHIIAITGGSNMSFVVDDQGQPGYAYGRGNDYQYRTQWQHDGRWQTLDATLHFTPLAITGDTVYGLQTGSHGTDVLVRQPRNGGPATILAEDSFASIDEVEWTPPPRQPFATTLAAGKPQAVYLEKTSLASRLHQQLSAQFPDEYVHFIDFSNDGGTLLFSVASDRSPHRYYLWQLGTRVARQLFTTAPWIQPQQMAERKFIRITSRDGLAIEVVLTIPRNASKQQPLPMVLMPHGGPYTIRDSWFFNADAQFLANRGYLVAQVNYRGSSGRGQHFEMLGYQHWGNTIQNDLIDATQQLIAQGYADPQRICTYGGSFGGYAAMMSAIRAPDLFRCAIGYAGIYDLEALHHAGDASKITRGQAALQVFVGDDPSDLAANSPVELAAQLKIPVLLIHGQDDPHTPYSQALAMRAALEKAGNPPQWLAIAGEGHGFYRMEHNVQRLQAIQTFLDQNIAPKVTVGPLSQQAGP